MKRILSPAISAILVVILLLSGCNSVASDPLPPEAPADVIAAWKTALPPNNSTPVISKQLSLLGYTQAQYEAAASLGFLTAGQWIDVIVTSTGVPAIWGNNEVGNTYLGFLLGEQEYGPSSIQELASGGAAISEAGGIPTFGKFLYLPQGYRMTETNGQTRYVTAYRLFIPVSSEYSLVFQNHALNTSVYLEYEVYEVAFTPSWALDYQVFAKELNDYFSLFPQERQGEAMARWMDQFK